MRRRRIKTDFKAALAGRLRAEEEARRHPDAAEPRRRRRRPSAMRRSRSPPTTPSRRITTIRWRCTPRPSSGKATADHRLRQDAGVAERPGLSRRVFGLSKDKVPCRNSLCRRRLRLRPAAAVPRLSWRRMAALDLKRSVRVTMTRAADVQPCPPAASCSRPLARRQRGRRACRPSSTVRPPRPRSYEDYMENIVNWGLMAYRCANAAGDYTLVALDTPTPGDMRAPGAATGMTSFECAIDELAYAAEDRSAAVSPAELRRHRPMSEASPSPRRRCARPTSGRRARSAGASRPLEPRSHAEGHELIGWGVATGMWDAHVHEDLGPGHGSRPTAARGRDRGVRHRHRHLHDPHPGRRRNARHRRWTTSASGSATATCRPRRSRAARGRRPRPARPFSSPAGRSAKSCSTLPESSTDRRSATRRSTMCGSPTAQCSFADDEQSRMRASPRS